MTTKFEATNTRINELEKRIDVTGRLAIIEAKLKEHDEALKKLTA